MADWIKKKQPTRNYFRAKGAHRLKARGWKKIFHANGNDEKAGAAILKIDFKTKILKIKKDTIE